jgi:3',5'-cyclic-AMP phosphodiesterase
VFKAIWMSDLHFIGVGDVLGHDPRIRLRAAIDFINHHHDDADVCIISGDMVDRATQTDYAALAVLLAELRIPVLPMVGNHDDRALFCAALPLPPQVMTDFVQYALPTSEGVILCLDTLKTGSDGGKLCAARLDWLRARLKQARNRPVYVFSHHPPMLLGLPMQDQPPMEGAEDLLSILGDYSGAKHLFVGHVHRPISGTVQGIPFAALPSVLYQAPAPRPGWDWESFTPAMEAPAIGVLTMSDGYVGLQYIQFCHHGLGVDK